MHYFYSDDKSGGKFDASALAKMDATAAHCRHHDQLLQLTFIAEHSQSTFLEKAQARKEMERARSTMKWWSHRTGFDADRAQAEKNKQVKVWQDHKIKQSA